MVCSVTILFVAGLIIGLDDVLFVLFPALVLPIIHHPTGWLEKIGCYVGCPVIIKIEQGKLIIELAMQF